MTYDVLILGGGVTGCSIARELSRYQLKIALAEAAEDVAMGCSRANSAIVHAGFDAAPGTLMAQLNVRGNALYDSWCRDLEVPLKRCGSLVVAFNAEEDATVRKLYERGIANGVPDLSVLSGEEARLKEPALSPNVTSALWAGTGAITCPYQFTIAAFENARQNGADYFFDAPATAVTTTCEGFSVRCGKNTISARYIINAAGIFADDVARLIGDESFTLSPRKGEYMLMDRTATCVEHVLFQTPSKMGKGILVSPTVDGNMFVGPTAQDITDKRDTSTTDEGITELKTASLKSVPSLNFRSVITAFAGVRAQPSTGDFILRASEKHPHFLHAAGICSPGLTSAPAIAQYMVKLLSDAGLTLIEKKDFNPHRPAIRRFSEMTNDERRQVLAENPLYGRIICRCETITEGEIVEAINRGARSLDGVKRRTRAGMGRCQGGFCSPRVMELLCRHTGRTMTELTKFGGASKLLVSKIKEEE